MSKIRLGIIGSGGFARYHLRTLCELPDFEITALCDPDPGQRRACVDAFPQLAGAAQFDDHVAFLGSGTADAVLICSPHTSHIEQGLAAFKAGLHVLVEKPLATTVADCKSLIAARDASGKVGAISYQRHGLGAFQYIKDLIAEGRYGKVLGLNSHLTQQWLQFTKGTWRQKLALSGGGQINDSGSHMVDILLWITGLKAKRVTSLMDNRGTEVDIDSVTAIEFEGGAYGTLTIIGDACLWHERHHIWLERAALILEGDDLLVIDEQGRHTRVSNWPPALSPDQNFADAILRGAPVLAPFECGLRTIELTEAAWKSAATGGSPAVVEESVARR
ncbi:MAG: Gfo/Idh/MocA family oxidoreductase [Armatimonadetes bacterium]|nr:Gfo/Idh/MocA family oxidoreductase [Armatimonadota bacterium]